MNEQPKNWVARRIIFEADIAAFWEQLCLELEDAARTFEQKYAPSQQALIKVYQKAWCLHVDYKPSHADDASAPRPRSVTVCLEAKKLAVISRIEGAEVATVKISCDNGGKAQAVDAEGHPLTNDAASQLLLQAYLFPGEFSLPILQHQP